MKGKNNMKVTIDGIQYEGTPAEIRDIVENPPHRKIVNIPDDWPDDGSSNYPRRRGIDLTPTVTWWDNSPYSEELGRLPTHNVRRPVLRILKGH